MTSNLSIDNQVLAGAFEEKLVPIIEQVIDGYGLAGLGVGIVKEGEVLFAQGFGKRNIDTGEPVTDRSLFHLASVSKSFVSTAIVQLWEGGHLDLDAPVKRYLPYFKLKGGDSEQITLRQLLSHTGGLPDTDDFGWHRSVFAGQPWASLLIWGFNARSEEEWRMYGLDNASLQPRTVRTLTKDMD